MTCVLVALYCTSRFVINRALRRLSPNDAAMATPAQEPRSETIGLSVTPTEKLLVKLVLQEHPEVEGASNLLRERSLAEVIREGWQIMARNAARSEREAVPA